MSTKKVKFHNVKVQYRIDKRERAHDGRLYWTAWDYWFTTERAARWKFDALYRNEGGERAQDFRIVKVIEAALPFSRESVTKSKKGSVRSDNARDWKKGTIGRRG